VTGSGWRCGFVEEIFHFLLDDFIRVVYVVDVIIEMEFSFDVLD